MILSSWEEIFAIARTQAFTATVVLDNEEYEKYHSSIHRHEKDNRYYIACSYIFVI